MSTPTSPRHGRARPQAGVMLLEALIAILIFSLGVMSIVQLQAVSVKQSADAQYRSMAALLASDLVSRMWASERTQQVLKDKFNSQSGTEFATWYQSVQASGLPNAAEANNRPAVTLTNHPTLAGATEASVTIYWRAPGKDEVRHAYVTVVVLR